MGLWIPQEYSAYTNACSTAETPTIEEMLATFRECKRKLDEQQSKIDPVFRTLRHPIEANLIESPYLADRVQVRFPRSKKKRIRRKFAKDPRNYRIVPKNEVYAIDGRLLMHPELAAKLRDKLLRQSIDRIESQMCSDRTRGFF